MPSLPTNFGLLPPELSEYATSEVAVLPVPFERTTSYGKGAAAGPAAILRASQAMELWDDELGAEACDQGIATLPPFLPDAFDMEQAMAELEAEAERHMRAGKFVVTLGGEHSLSIAPIRAARSVFGPIGVLQFDAHSDLREEFDGTPYSHASVMRRVHEDGIPAAAIGIRSLSKPEADLIRASDLAVLWGRDLERAEALLPALLDRLPDALYLTFDIDYFDPALVPATGTPEPGGGSWYQALRLLREVFRRKRVVAMDVVELAPFAPLPASDFLAAKLIYKCLGYRREAAAKI
jgi:agmatinase